MATINKPNDLSTVWSSAGDMVKPPNTKIATGWEIEVPPRQWFNWIDNRQDQAIAHINQHGIAVWDSLTEYQASKSYTQGSDGIVYKCKVTNSGNDPVLDIAGTYWKKAFFEVEDTPSDPNQVTLPGGIVFKWGNATVASGGTVLFDTPFGSEVISVIIAHGPGADNPLSSAISTQNLAGFTVLHENGAGMNGFSYFAVGRD